jgi:hypothetical protein
MSGGGLKPYSRTVLGLREGHLVYAKGNEPATTHAVAGADISIHCHALDLTASPTDLLRQIVELASLVTRRQPGDNWSDRRASACRGDRSGGFE